MFSQSHRMTRSTFPGWNVPKKQWNGKTIRCVFFPPFSPLLPTTVAVVVAKKYAKHATDRHLFKRRVFAVLKEQGLDTLLPHRRVVIFPLRSLEQISFTEIQEDVIHCIAATPWESAS